MEKPFTDFAHEQIRLIDPTKPVRVYRNLHRGCFSVKQGVVRFHANQVWLHNARFIVNETGRLRVLRERQKNVHAYVEGYLSLRDGIVEFETTVSYNPYICGDFVTPDGPVRSCELIRMNCNIRATLQIFKKLA
jgi:hypothetical protein